MFVAVECGFPGQKVLHYNSTHGPASPILVPCLLHRQLLCAAVSRAAIASCPFRGQDPSTAAAHRLRPTRYARGARRERSADARRCGELFRRRPRNDRPDGPGAFRGAPESQRDFWFACRTRGPRCDGDSHADGGGSFFHGNILCPRVASLTDRFEIFGKGFCGDADANQVRIARQPALVLASSPVSLVILPPSDLRPGEATVEISCAKGEARPFSLALVELDLVADSSPLKPGEHRQLTVRVRGTTAKISLEARNLAPGIAELAGSNPARALTSGGTENLARFEVTGRKNGNFLISIRLVPSLARPQ